MASVAISLGVAAATNFLLGLFKSKDENETEIPLPTSDFGSPISDFYGVVRQNGCKVFWALPIDEETRRRGKGGGRREETTYLINAAFLIGGEISSVRRIWANSQLVYSTIGDTETDTSSSEFLDDYCTIYDGTQITADPTILSSEDEAPSFRGKSYLVLRDYPTSEFGGGTSLPRIDVEVVSGPSPIPLNTVISDVLNKAGVNSYTVDVDGTIEGIRFENGGQTYRDFLEFLSQLYQLVSYESLSSLVIQNIYKPRSVLLLTDDYLSTTEESTEAVDRYEEVIMNDRELPSKVEISFKNISNNHDDGYQFSYNPLRTTEVPINISGEWVATDNQALTQSLKILQQLELQRFRYEKVQLPPYCSGLVTGDLVYLPVRGVYQPIQIEKMSIGANLITTIEGYRYGSVTPSNGTFQPNDGYTTIEVDNPYTYTPTNNIVSYDAATVLPLDIPLLSETDSEVGLYIAISVPIGGTWVAGTVYSSIDNSGDLRPVSSVNSRSVIGTVTTGVLNTGYNDGDTDTTSVLEVTLTSGESLGLEPSTNTEFNNNTRFALIGDEIVVFKDVTETSPGVWEITTFKRGYRGTVNSIDTHTTSEQFVLLSSYITRIEGVTDDIGKTAYFKVLERGQQLANVPLTNHLIVGNSLKPFPVENIQARLDANDSFLITWDNVPRFPSKTLGETTPNYQITILSNSTNLPTATLTSNTSSVVYSDPQSTTEVRAEIHKISSLVGLGFKRRTIPIPIVTPVPGLADTGELLGSILRYPYPQGDAPRLISEFDTVVQEDDQFILIEKENRYHKIELRDINLIRSESLAPSTYTLQLSDRGKERYIDAGDHTITIPEDTANEFPSGWYCFIALDGQGVVTFEAENTTTMTLIFSGSTNHNKLKRPGTVGIRYRGSKVWKLEGGLEI